VDGQYPRSMKDRAEIQGRSLKERRKIMNDHRLANNDPGSNAYGVAVVVDGETFTRGWGVRDPLRVIVEDKRVLPGAPLEPEVTPTGSVLRSWLMK